MNDPEKLISRCLDIFKEMEKFYGNHKDTCTGFNFSYSPKESWEAMPNVLLLTYHPQPHKNESPENPQPSPACPWPEPPEPNDFFNPSRWEGLLFPERILTIAAEIASCKDGINYTASMDNKTLEKFVDTNMVLASFVPFRTANPRQKDLVEFSKEQYWGEIWRLWQPGLIIATGDYPFGGTERVLRQLGWDVRVLTESPTWKFGTRKNKATPLSKGKYKIHVCTDASSGKNIYLLSVPSPSAEKQMRGNCGYPDAELYVPNKAPIQDFIGNALYYIEMQRHQ